MARIILRPPILDSEVVPMWIYKIVFWTVKPAVLLIRPVKFLLAGAAVISTACFIFLFSVQMLKWGRTDDWYAMPLSEVLHNLRMDPLSSAFARSGFVDGLLNIPISIILLVAALVLSWTWKSLHRLTNFIDENRFIEQQRALIEDIERALAHQSES